MLVIKTRYCLPFHRVAIITCLIAVTFGINLLVGLVSQNSFAQDIMDTNGDGVVDASDAATTTDTTNASSTDEIQMDTNGDGVVDDQDTTAAEAIPGDTNGDGVVDEQDTTAAEAIPGDTNGDGVVDDQDTTAVDDKGAVPGDTNGDGVVDEQDTVAGDTNGDGVVDELDTQTPATTTDTTNASSTDEIQMDTNGDGVVDAQDEVAQTPTETPTDTGETPTETPTDTGATPTETPTEEIQMDTNGDGVVDELDETTATPTETPTDTGATPTETPTDTGATPTETPTDTGATPTETPTDTGATPTETPTEEIQMDTNGDGVVDAFDEMPDFKPCNPNSPTLRIGKDGTVGSIGPKVKELQSHLTDLGYEKFLGPPGIDGKFGPYTEGAVKQFQIDMGLKGKDGIAGPETWAKICELLSLANKSKPLYVSQQYSCNPNSDTVEPDSENAKVIELQTYLTDLGYGDLLEPEKIDGKFGPHTKNAVIAYQNDFGLSNDEKGIVGPQTWLSLCDQISLLPKTFPTNNTP